MTEVLYGRSGPHHPPEPDPDFPVVGTVKYELHTEMTGVAPGPEDRCCIKRVEVLGIFENRAEARQWMLDHEDEWRRDPTELTVNVSSTEEA